MHVVAFAIGLGLSSQNQEIRMQEYLMMKIPTLILLALLPSVAFAYLDPATGSIILQGIIAALAAAAATFRLWWHRFKSLFSRKPRKSE